MEPVHVKSVKKFQNALLISNWEIALNFLLISISGNSTWTELGGGRWGGKTSFYSLFFFINKFFVCFVQFHSHVISFNFFFFKNKFIHCYMWSSVFFLKIRLKCRQECRKVAQKLPSEWFHFLIAPSCFNKQQKCRYERTFKERNSLALIPVFQI